MYGLKSDPRSGFFFWETHGAERSGYPYLQKPTDYYGADFPPWQWHGSERSGLSVLICCHGLERICPRLSRSGSDRISARGKCHGLSRSGYPPSKNSRIFAERISVKRIFHGADYLTPSNKPHTPWDLSTVHRSNNPLNINGYPRIVDGYPRTSTMKGDNNETMMINNTSSSASTTDSVASVKMEEARYSYSYCCMRKWE